MTRVCKPVKPVIDPWFVERHGDTKVEIQACPFCGGKPEYEGVSGECPGRAREDGVSIACTRCNCHGPMKPTMDAAARAWNRRIFVPAQCLPKEKP